MAYTSKMRLMLDVLIRLIIKACHLIFVCLDRRLSLAAERKTSGFCLITCRKDRGGRPGPSTRDAVDAALPSRAQIAPAITPRP